MRWDDTRNKDELRLLLAAAHPLEGAQEKGTPTSPTSTTRMTLSQLKTVRESSTRSGKAEISLAATTITLRCQGHIQWQRRH